MDDIVIEIYVMGIVTTIQKKKTTTNKWGRIGFCCGRDFREYLQIIVFF